MSNVKSAQLVITCNVKSAWGQKIIYYNVKAPQADLTLERTRVIILFTWSHISRGWSASLIHCIISLSCDKLFGSSLRKEEKEASLG